MSRDSRVTARPSVSAAYLAWSTCVVTLTLTGVGIGLLVSLNLSHPDFPVYQYWAHATAITVAFSTVGPLIASRRPEHRIGWLFCAIGFFVGIDHLCGSLLATSDVLRWTLIVFAAPPDHHTSPIRSPRVRRDSPGEAGFRE